MSYLSQLCSDSCPCFLKTLHLSNDSQRKTSNLIHSSRTTSCTRNLKSRLLWTSSVWKSTTASEEQWVLKIVHSSVICLNALGISQKSNVTKGPCYFAMVVKAKVGTQGSWGSWRDTKGRWRPAPAFWAGLFPGEAVAGGFQFWSQALASTCTAMLWSWQRLVPKAKVWLAWTVQRQKDEEYS